MNPQDELFLIESNLIEGVGQEGLKDSITAYLYLMQVKPPLTLKHILKTHRLLMRNLNPRIAGIIRKVPVGIYSGGKLIRSCPKPEEIERMMERFLRRMEEPSDNSGSFCQSCHIEFEMMHPFEDGNGRVGRMILNWHRKQMRLSPLIIYNQEKQKYYNWFGNNLEGKESLGDVRLYSK